MSETQLKKFVDKQKVIKLIDRIYSLQSINNSQFDTVAQFIVKHGTKRPYHVEYGQHKSNKESYTYLGIVYIKDFDRETFMFFDTYTSSRKFVTKYNDGNQIRN